MIMQTGHPNCRLSAMPIVVAHLMTRSFDDFRFNQVSNSRLQKVRYALKLLMGTLQVWSKLS